MTQVVYHVQEQTKRQEKIGINLALDLLKRYKSIERKKYKSEVWEFSVF